MMPQREVSLGLAHRLLIPGWRLEGEEDTTSCLVAARDVPNLDEGASEDTPDTDVTYYNFVFDEPQVFCVNGLPVESYTPDSQALDETPLEVREKLQGLFPDFAAYPETTYKKRQRISYTPEFAKPETPSFAEGIARQAALLKSDEA